MAELRCNRDLTLIKSKKCTIGMPVGNQRPENLIGGDIGVGNVEDRAQIEKGRKTPIDERDNEWTVIGSGCVGYAASW